MTQQTVPLEALVEQALQVLAALGILLTGLTARRQQKMAKAFLAVAGLHPGMNWQDAKDNQHGRRLTSRQIIAFMNAHLGESISDSSYDDIRRKDLLLPDADTNHSTRGFALNRLAGRCP